MPSAWEQPAAKPDGVRARHGCAAAPGRDGQPGKRLPLDTWHLKPDTKDNAAGCLRIAWPVAPGGALGAMLRQRGHIRIVGSGETRNGKTLLARLLTDFILLADGDPMLFDADAPHGRLADWYPERAEIVDLKTTGGQIALFDRVLEAPERDYIVDLPARDLMRFFAVVQQTGFIEETKGRGLGAHLLFVLDRPDVTLEALRTIRASLDGLRIVPVFNEASRINARLEGGETAAGVLAEMAELRLPRLDREMMRIIEHRSFSFLRFLQEGEPELRALPRTVLRGFLRTVLGQFHDLGLVAGASALKRVNLV